MRRLLPVAVSAAVLAGACAPSGEAPSPTDATQTAARYDGSLLLGGGICYEDSYPTQRTVNTGKLTDRIGGEATFSTVASNALTYAGAYPSAPVFTVGMNVEGALVYVDETGGELDSFADSERLLGALVCNKELLAATLQTGALGSLQARIFQNRNGDGYNRSGLVDFVYEVPADADPTINSFLPTNQIVEQETLLVQYRHEILHAALSNGELSSQLQPAERQVVEQACTIIRQSATQEAGRQAYRVVQNLRTLQSQIDPQYRDAFQTVIDAIQQGTYDQLPVEADQSGQVDACYVQSPLHAVRQVALANGSGADAYAGALRSLGLDETIGAIYDDWFDLLEESTIYSFFKEGNYMGYGQSNNEFGHEPDGSDETLTSFLNVALSFPSKVAPNMSARMTAQERDAALVIIQAGIATVKHNFPNNAELAEWLDARYSLFASLLAN